MPLWLIFAIFGYAGVLLGDLTIQARPDLYDLIIPPAALFLYALYETSIRALVHGIPWRFALWMTWIDIKRTR